VEKTGGGLLVAPDDAGAIADGLHQLWADRALSARLADEAFDGVRAHYTVAASATRLIDVYERVARRAGADASC
jgi:glycosyltransferase involved in cell wall biosynthesis